MEKSGQRTAHPAIIDARELKTKKRVFGEILITLSFWALVLYLLEFLITFFLWLFGFNLMHLELYDLGNQEMVGLFKNAGRLTLIILLLTLSWSYYNMLMFKIRGERRGHQVRICLDKDLAEFFKVDAAMLEQVKNYPCVSVLLEENSIIIRKSVISDRSFSLPR